MGKVILIRPDGTRLQVDEDAADRLKVLGYRQEDTGETLAHATAEANQEFFTRPSQVAKAAVEGAASGLTLGVSDPLLKLLGDDDIGQRAAYNPGTRLASEFVGAIAPALLTGGATAPVSGVRGASTLGKVLAHTPAGALAKATSGLGTVTRGVVEGAAYGAGGAVSHAALSGDPLTSESVLAGAGWGSFLGGGLGVAVKGAEKVGSKLAELKVPRTIPTEAWTPLKTEVQGLTATADRLVEEMSRAPSAALKDLSRAGGGAAAAGDAVAMKEARAAWTKAQRAIDSGDPAKVEEAIAEYTNLVSRSRAIKEYQQGSYEVNEFLRTGKGDAQRMGALTESLDRELASRKTTKDLEVYRGVRRSHLDKADPGYLSTSASREVAESFAHHVPGGEGSVVRIQVPKGTPYTKIPGPDEEFVFPRGSILQLVGEKDGVTTARLLAGEVAPVPAASTNPGVEAFRTAKDLAGVTAVLRSFPYSPRTWTNLSKASAETLHAALEKVGELAAKVPELAPHVPGIERAIKGLTEAAGAADTGMAGLRTAWAASRQAEGARVVSNVEKILARKATSTAGSFLGSILGFKTAGPLGAFGAYKLARGALGGELAGLKAAVSKTLSESGALLAKGTKVASKGVGRADPLRRRLDGSKDDEPGTRAEVFYRRKAEIANATSHVNDTLFKAISPIATEQPEVARGMHASAVNAFKALYGLMPKDPGTAQSGFKSLRTPDPVAIERFARAYDVFHDALGVFSGQRTPSADHVQALQSMYPALATELRLNTIGAYQPGESVDAISRQSIALGVPAHSIFRPQWIAAQQAMFAKRAVSFEGQGKGQSGGQVGNRGGGGAGSGASGQPTAAQKVTEQ